MGMSVCRDSEDASVASASCPISASAFAEMSNDCRDEDMVACVYGVVVACVCNVSFWRLDLSLELGVANLLSPLG